MSHKPFDNCRLALKELNKQVVALDQMRTYLAYLEKTILKAIKDGYLVGSLHLYNAPTDERITNTLYEWGFYLDNDEGCWFIILDGGSRIEINYLDMEVYDLITREVTKV